MELHEIACLNRRFRVWKNKIKSRTHRLHRQKRDKVTRSINCFTVLFAAENSFNQIYIIESEVFLFVFIYLFIHSAWRGRQVSFSSICKIVQNAVNSLSGYIILLFCFFFLFFDDEIYCADRHQIENNELIRRLTILIHIDYLLWLLAISYRLVPVNFCWCNPFRIYFPLIDQLQFQYISITLIWHELIRLWQWLFWQVDLQFISNSFIAEISPK